MATTPQRDGDDDADQSDQSADDEGDEGDEDGEAVDAIELLQSDHDEVKQMFEDYEALLEADAPDEEREELAGQICIALTVHAMIEEEVLYPAAREALDNDRLIDEAAVEHAVAKSLIAEIESMTASDPLYDAKVTVLGDYIGHHIELEEEELLTQLSDSGVDLEALGSELLERKQELLADLGADESS